MTPENRARLVRRDLRNARAAYLTAVAFFRCVMAMRAHAGRARDEASRIVWNEHARRAAGEMFEARAHLRRSRARTVQQEIA